MKKNVLSIPRNTLVRLRKLLIIMLVSAGMMAITHVQAQPILLKHLSAASKNFTTVNGKLYYSHADSLFISNGTPAGTVLVKKLGETILRISNVPAGSNAVMITQTGSQESLWKTDGTAAGTIKVGTHNSIIPLISYKNELYLKINNGTNGQELWKLNSSGSLSMLKDIYPGSGHGFAEDPYTTVEDIAISDNVLYFIADAGSGRNLWKTDGTSSGTVLAADLPHNDFHGLTDVNGMMFLTRTYSGWDQEIGELWKTDGTAATTVLVKIFDDDYAGSYNSLQHLTSFKGKLYFIRNHGIPNHALWVSDGTEAGTQFIKEVTIDGGASNFEKTNDHLAFDTQSQGFPGAVFKSDGTSAGTVPIHDLSWYHYGDFINLTATPELLFFVDDIRENDSPAPGGHMQLWQANLVTGQKVTLKELYGVSLEGTDNVSAAGDKIFFTTAKDNVFKLWYYDPAGIPLCSGTGSILREVWLGVQGTQVSNIPVNSPPSRREKLTVFEAPTNYGDHYGNRLRGYLCVPKSGNYRFWIASNDNSELWLSTTDDPANKVKIAFVNGYTNVRQYNKYPSQQSALIPLVAGQFYYIEALHKEGVGTDHLSVGMQLPDGSLERPIPGNRLVPYDLGLPTNRPPVVSFVTPQDGQTFTAPATVNIRVNATDDPFFNTIAKVEFYRNGVKLGHDLTPPYTFTWTNVPAGNYTLVADAFDNEGGVGSDTVHIIVNGSSTARISEPMMAEDKGNVNLKPNPIVQGPVTLTFEELTEKNNDMYIEVVSMMGNVMYSGQVSCRDNCNDIKIQVTDAYKPGVYVVRGVVNGKSFSRRLLVQ